MNCRMTVYAYFCGFQKEYATEMVWESMYYSEHIGRETSKIQDHCGEEPLQIVGKLHLWQIRGDWIETNESEVR